MPMLTRTTFNSALVAALLGLSLDAIAQADRPIKFLVGFAPGGSTDTVARVLADNMARILKQPVIVENKPGAGGRLAAQALKASASHGSTYMIAPNGTPIFQTLLYSPEVLKYDMLRDFTPMGVLVSYPLALVVGQQAQVNSVREYVAWLHADPKRRTFGSAGAGGHTHFSGIQFGKAIGTELQVVAYRGNSAIVTDLLGGQLPAAVMAASDVIGYHKNGKVKLLGVFGRNRSPVLPDVPTLREQGIAFDAGDAWIGMWARAGTSKAEIDRVQDAVKQVLQMPKVRDLLQTRAALTPDFRTAAQMDALQRNELAYWAPIIKATGFKPDR